jgi:hypothetical protein
MRGCNCHGSSTTTSTPTSRAHLSASLGDPGLADDDDPFQAVTGPWPAAAAAAFAEPVQRRQVATVDDQGASEPVYDGDTVGVGPGEGG